MIRMLPQWRFWAAMGLAIGVGLLVGCTFNESPPLQVPQYIQNTNTQTPSSAYLESPSTEFDATSTDALSIDCNAVDRVSTHHSLIKNYPKQQQAFAPQDCAQTCWQLFNRHLAKRMALGFKAVENFTVTQCGSSVSAHYGVNLACQMRFTVVQQDYWVAKICAASTAG